MTLIGPFVLGLVFKLWARSIYSAPGVVIMYVHVIAGMGLPVAGYAVSYFRQEGRILHWGAWLEKNIWTALEPLVFPTVVVVCLFLPAAIFYLLGLFLGAVLVGDFATSTPPSDQPSPDNDSDSPPPTENRPT